MRTYYIFNINNNFSSTYKNKPFKMYKILEEIYYTKDYNLSFTYHIFNEVANKFHKNILNNYIYDNYKYLDGYIKDGNTHIINNNNELSKLVVSSSSIRIKSLNNYTLFFNLLSLYDDNLFICDFNNKDYFWLSKLRVSSLQKEEMIVK